MKKFTFHVLICEAEHSVLINFAFISNNLTIRQHNFLIKSVKIFSEISPVKTETVFLFSIGYSLKEDCKSTPNFIHKYKKNFIGGHEKIFWIFFDKCRVIPSHSNTPSYKVFFTLKDRKIFNVMFRDDRLVWADRQTVMRGIS